MASKSKAKAKPASKKPPKVKPPAAAKLKPAPKPRRPTIEKPGKAEFGAIKGRPEQPSGWLGGLATFDERAQPRRLASKIKIGKRFRTDFSHVPALARDFNERGMLQPVVIDRDDNLVAGECRIKAWEHEDCQWRGTPLPVVVLPIEDLVAGEWAENNPELRKPFNPTEMVAIKRALEPKFKEAAKERQRTHKKGDSAGRAADAAAAFTGGGRRTIEKAEAVVEAAEQDPERFGKLAQDMDRTKRVDGPFKRLQNMLSGDRIKAEPPPAPMQGPYRTLVVDFPWPADLDGYRDPAERGYYPYATMSMDEIVAYAAEQIAPILHEEGASVWLWIPNFHLVRGCHVAVLKALGVEGSTMLTWAKPEIGQGQRLRGATEHAILAVKGKVPVLGTEQRTWFEAPGGKAHSAKPQAFFDIVEKVTPAPRYAFLFAGGSVPENWDGHGDRIGTYGDGVARPLSPEHAQSPAPDANYPGDDEHKSEITELQALETIEAGREIDLAAVIVAELKANKLARGSVKLKLTKLGMVHLENLRKEEYSKSEGPQLPDRGDDDQVVENNIPAAASPADFYPEAVRVVMEGQKASTSYVQRRLQIGYNHAASLMERMEREGLVSPRNHAGKREILTPAPFESQVDCRVCSVGAGVCAQCIAAADHVISHRDGDFELDMQPTVNCSCGWSHEYPRGGSDAAEDAINAAIKSHWQNVVTEANAAAASVEAPPAPAPAPLHEAFDLDIPERLRRRAPAEAAE